MAKPLVLFACLTLSLMADAAAADWTVVHAGRLLAVPGTPATTEQSIVAKDGVIVAVEKGYVRRGDLDARPSDTVRIHDLSEAFVLPGLIDGHVHLTLELDAGERLRTVTRSPADMAVFGARKAEISLMAGFTTVRDVGAWSSEAVFAIRDGIARGDIIGSRVLAAGETITITGGHGDGSQGYRDDLTPLLQSDGTCDGPDACRAAVREQIRRGADLIKFTATGGVLSEAADGLGQQFFDDEMAAIVDTAHSMGRKVTAHAHGKNGIDAALRAGVDSIEHGTFLDAATIRLFKKSGAYLAPTLAPFWFLGPAADDPTSALSEFQRAKVRAVLDQAKIYVTAAHDAGVLIAFATDAGVYPHGLNAKEFSLLTEWAGMTPMEAIHTATVAGAANIGESDRLGTLEVGKLADLIAVTGDPLTNIEELETVDFVMKDGIVYKAMR